MYGDWGSTYNGHKQPDISLGELVTNEVILPSENLLEAVERVKEWDHSSFVRRLGGSKSRLVYTILNL